MSEHEDYERLQRGYAAQTRLLELVIQERDRFRFVAEAAEQVNRMYRFYAPSPAERNRLLDNLSAAINLAATKDNADEEALERAFRFQRELDAVSSAAERRSRLAALREALAAAGEVYGSQNPAGAPPDYLTGYESASRTMIIKITKLIEETEHKC